MCKCVFCNKENIITDFVYEDELVMAFMDMYYLINYGYVEGIMAPDGEEQYFDSEIMM